MLQKVIYRFIAKFIKFHLHSSQKWKKNPNIHASLWKHRRPLKTRAILRKGAGSYPKT
jgi:hypothetical protein